MLKPLFFFLFYNIKIKDMIKKIKKNKKLSDKYPSFCEMSEFERPFHPKVNLIKSPHHSKRDSKGRKGWLFGSYR